MKYLRTIMVLLILCVPILAEDFIVTEAEYVTVSGNTSDTLGRGRITPDSIRIVVTDSALTELFDAWFEPADAQCALNGNVISFSDQWEDINGAASVGIFSIHVEIASDGQGDVDVFGGREYTLRGVTVAVNTTFDEVSRIGDSVDAYDDWVAQNAFFDTLIYIGPRGLGIYLDSTSGNTNTVLGVDGTASNPVSTFVAARTLSDALSVKRYYFLNRSTFLGATVDLAADHQDFEFIGIGHENALAFGGQRVDGGMFENMTLSGAMHASGGDVLYVRCTLGLITANFNGTVDNSWLIDTIVAKNGRDLNFHDCQSGVAGNSTPTIDLSGGQSSLSMRNYSGGIRIMNGSSDDTLSIETDGQVIIDASNTSLVITLRGNMTITDNGTTTDITRDAALNGEYLTDLTWDEPVSGHTVPNTFGDTLTQPIVNDSIKSDGSTLAATTGAITAATIATNAIGALEIAADAIGSSEIAADAIGASEIAASAIGADELATNAIGATEIATDAIGSAEIASQAIGSAELAPNAIGASELATDAVQEISDMVWDQVSQGAVVEDSTGNNTTRVQTNLTESTDDQYNGQLVLFMDGTEAGEARLITDYDGTNGYLVFTPALIATPGTGDSLRILPWGYIQDVVTGAGSISDADMIAIVDTLMKRIVSDDTTAGAGFDKAFADFLWRSGDTTNWANLIDVWRNQDTANVDSSDIGDWLVNNLSGAASGIDSTTLSNILHRIVWGTAVGSGGDSSTIAQRDATVAAIVNDIITAASIAANAIGASEIASSAIGASEFADAAITADVIANNAIGASEIATDAIGAAEIAAGAITPSEAPYLAFFDTLIYGGAVWVDNGANTNTVVGTDGTPTNPVGTIAAAKTIADAIGVKKIFFVEGTNETLAATMEHYEFIGLGAMMDVSIALGSQDVDGSKFENVYISGIQGGTGSLLANSCILDGADSLEIHAIDCAIQGPLSVRGGDSYFDNCYSTVAGNGTPNLDFDGDAAVIDISMRHYSGGLQLLGMTSNHTISYESDGQLVINADCVSGNVVARGNMTITDNGTTTSITQDAVFSRGEADLWVWANVDTAGSVDTSDVGDWLKNNISLIGAGTDTLRMYAFDTTTAINAVVEDATITAVSPGNVVVAQGSTNASGYIDFLLDAGVDYVMSAVGPPGNYWHSGVTKTNDAGLDTDSIFGWTLSTSVPSATQVCNVSVIVRKNNGDPHPGVWVTAMLQRSNVRDSSGYAVSNIAVRAKTDATGTAVLTLRWSSYLIPATDWRITAGGVAGAKCTYTVPRETTQTIDLSTDCN